MSKSKLDNGDKWFIAFWFLCLLGLTVYVLGEVMPWFFPTKDPDPIQAWFESL